ncbi:hypothetical protein Q31a_52930 [Aureliella helgolandensis]|uniref:Uncharacterized protein n=1 Tax=Aureliella helgolandensis TaxID=2527968 RepID=A0A518GE95_9BACT|nr:hypothetical protein Q31a_52930 [Aureliella helgolandensis]
MHVTQLKLHVLDLWSLLRIGEYPSSCETFHGLERLNSTLGVILRALVIAVNELLGHVP